MNHRNFLYDIGGEIMDLRHDILFALKCYREDAQYPREKIVERLAEFEDRLAEYADRQLNKGEPNWQVETDGYF